MLDTFLYKIKNWKAKLRAITLGTTNQVDDGTGGVIVMRGTLAAKVIKANGKTTNLGIISERVVTTAGVNFMRDDFNAATGGADITNVNFHDSGTGSVAEAIGDTDLGTVAGPVTRATGTQSSPASKQYRSVGTISYSGTLAITEHGIFSSATRGAGVLWDRSVFTAINVVSGDSIQFTYTLTINDGG